MTDLNYSIPAEILWTDDSQPISQLFDDVYFSRENGLEESRYVFIEHNQLPSRWRDKNLPPQTFTIGETGFGTGLNFLNAWQLWRDCSKGGAENSACQQARLHFVSVEKHPLKLKDLAQALQAWPELKTLSRALIEHYPPVPTHGFHRLSFDSGRVVLTLIFDDALEALQQLLPSNYPGLAKQSFGGPLLSFNAWFLDGFAPSKNPMMWHTPLLQTIAQLSEPGTTLATFTAAGQVRRNLTELGFQIDKVPGFANKREMLCGVFRGKSDPLLKLKPEGSPQKTWLATSPQFQTPCNKALIIGAGLAGCHTANALAQRGYQVTIVDTQAQAAMAASGNSQGTVYAKLSNHRGPLADFNQAALLFALRLYTPLWLKHPELGERCGVLQLAQNKADIKNYQQLATKHQHNPEHIQWLEAEETHSVCGVSLKQGGLFLPQAGWFDSQALCRKLLQHTNINFFGNKKITQLDYGDGEWLTKVEHTDEIFKAPCVIIANASHATELLPRQHFPLKRIRGQVTLINATATSRQLCSVVCGRGYIAPARNGQHCIGATFNLGEDNPEVVLADHEDNLAALALLSDDFAKQLQAMDLQQLSGRVSFRCTTPDYFPVVGPVPEVDTMMARFAPLRRSAKAVIREPGAYLPGLFINVGHGSRGLAYTPLCAELIASLINGEALPVGRNLLTHLHPARFLIRNLIRRLAQ